MPAICCECDIDNCKNVLNAFSSMKALELIQTLRANDESMSMSCSYGHLFSTFEECLLLS